MTPVTDKTDSVEEVSDERLEALRLEFWRQSSARGIAIFNALTELRDRRSIANTAGERVKIKALEWVEERSRAAPFNGPEVVCIWSGQAVAQRWATIIECDDGRFTLLSDPTCERYDTLDEAKAAAQADYEQRIRSALTSPQADHFAGAGNMVETPQAGAGEAVRRVMVTEEQAELIEWVETVFKDPVNRAFEYNGTVYLYNHKRSSFGGMFWEFVGSHPLPGSSAVHPAPQHNDLEAEARGAERMKERAAEVADEHEKARWGGTADPTVAVRTTALSIATAIRNLETKDAG